MNNLYDKDIRVALIKRLCQQTIKPHSIVEELRVHNGNAIADVVALFNESHCYEIKSDFDNISRVIKQGSYYDVSFRKITLVTTEKHLKKALGLIPKHWGLLIASSNDEKVSFRYIRKTKINSNFSKFNALKMLWKEEMLTLNNSIKHKRKSEIIEIISKEHTKSEISKSITSLLIGRYN